MTQSLDLDRALNCPLPDLHYYPLNEVAPGAEGRIAIALPVGYGRAKRQSFPGLILIGPSGLVGTAAEQSRLMADTGEVNECIVVSVEAEGLIESPHEFFESPNVMSKALLEQYILPWCERKFRVNTKKLAVFAHSPNSGNAVFASCAWEAGVLNKGLALVAREADLIPGAYLARGLSEFWSTGKEYGQEASLLAKPAVTALSAMLRPLIKAVKPDYKVPAGLEDGALLWSKILEREFEVFVHLPESYASEPTRHYPLLLALDANYCFASVSEMSAYLASRGYAQELIVVGLGVPRKKGPTEFALRRLEEFSPLSENYQFKDELGRALSSIFSVSGKDIRSYFGRAPELYRFIRQELLSQLLEGLRIDRDELGLLGHSAGGTFVGYVLQQDDSPFKRYICSSPGIGISGDWLMNEKPPRSRRYPERAVVMGLGTEEYNNAFNIMAGIPKTLAFASSLSEVLSMQVNVVEFEGETHSSVLPSMVAHGIKNLWPAASKENGPGAQQGKSALIHKEMM